METPVLAHLPQGVDFGEAEMGSGAVAGIGAFKLGDGKCYTCLREALKARDA